MNGCGQAPKHPAATQQVHVTIATRSMIPELFQLSHEFVEPSVDVAGASFVFEHRRFVDSDACGYFRHLLAIETDWVVNLDEDAFLLDPAALCHTIQFMDRIGYAACGMPDGGAVPIRYHNPVACNAFFNIFDMRRVRPVWSDWDQAVQCPFREEFADSISAFARRSGSQMDYFEPYYGLFFSLLARRESILYLSAEEWTDGISTLLRSPTAAPLVLHAWYAREWRNVESTRQRIMALSRAAQSYRRNRDWQAGDLMASQERDSQMGRGEWKWAVGMFSAPRPKPLIGRTLESLARAGFTDVNVTYDLGRRDHMRAWLTALKSLLARSPDCDAYLICEDDVIFCRGLRNYLEQTLWPAARSSVAICSPYTPSPYRRQGSGWHCEERGFGLISSLAWVISPEAARLIVDEFHESESFQHGADALIGQWALESGKSVWFHTPSLAQHTGLGNSAMGNDSLSDARMAADFIGEDVDPSMTVQESNRGKWQSFHQVNAMCGDETSYAMGTEWLRNCSFVEDWGCGTGCFSRLMKAVNPQARVIGLDGSPRDGAIEVDLVHHLSQIRPDGIFMRHVLEHNWRWREILDNALQSFKLRMALVLFTELEDVDRNIYDHPIGVPVLCLSRRDLEERLNRNGLQFQATTFSSGTEFGSETIYRIERA